MADCNRIGGVHYEMMRACYNEKSVTFKSIGAKGITVCDDWKDREAFKEWAYENGYEKGLRIERIDKSKGYEPSNCRFGITNCKNKNSNSQKVKRTRQEHLAKMEYAHIKSKGYSDGRLYRVYKAMLTRCYNPNYKHYAYYGGRGIVVCDEWLGKDGFYNFHKWAVENGYKEDAPKGECTLDRINPNGNYQPSNCRFITIAEQQRNKRNSIILEYKGKKMCLSEIARDLGYSYGSLHKRIRKDGMTLDEAIADIKKKVG